MTSTTDHVIFFAELAVGIILGFVAWSFVAPSLTASIRPNS